MIYTTLAGEIIGDTYHAFDLLSDEQTRNKPCVDRAMMLYGFRFGDAIRPVYTAETVSQKKSLFEKLKNENREGIVFKQAFSTYSPGRPASLGPMLKHKFVASATCIVSGHTVGKRSVELFMHKDLMKTVAVGKVTIPPNFDVPPVGAYVEVRYLYAYKGGSLYQPVYLGQRVDQGKEDCMISQLKYKAEE